MTKLLTPGAACVIPESLGGMPVTELADRALANQPMKEVYLPKTLRRIGRYGFYNCENLQILHVYAETTEIGGGVFNASRNIREIYMHMGDQEQSGLYDFVTEITGRILVHYLTHDGDEPERETARLIYPEYYDEAIENTPARNLSFAIHGSGKKYRYSFSNHKIQFDRYDKIFFHEKNEESIPLAAEIAVNRLMFPYRLRDEDRWEYEKFLTEHQFEILKANVRNIEMFRWLVAYVVERTKMPEAAYRDTAYRARGQGWDTAFGLTEQERNGTSRLTEQELDVLLAVSAESRLTEISGILLDLKHRMYPPKKKAFTFEF